jgi:uncharacterized protein (TIGR02001 family)
VIRVALPARGRFPRRAVCLVALSTLLASGAAHAQFSASVGVETDHRFRGVSLSDGQPDAHLSVAYDHASGVFAGASATRVEFMRGRRSVQLLGDVGVATRVSSDFNAEAGVTSSAFSGNARYNYSEAFVGVSGERWSLRVYWAPNYFGFDQSTAYAELDANAPLQPQLRVFGHVGALTTLHGVNTDDRNSTRYDARVGVGFAALTSLDVQLAWVAATRSGPYVVDYGNRRNTWVLSATASF